MACEIISSPGAVFCVWGLPTLADMDRVGEALKDAVKACGHPVVYVTRVPEGAPPPRGEVRARLDRLMVEVAPCFSSYHVVLEGDGFTASFKRGVLLGLFQLSWRRDTFFVHSSVDEVLGAVSADHRDDVRRLFAAAEAAELFTVRSVLPRPA